MTESADHRPGAQVGTRTLTSRLADRIRHRLLDWLDAVGGTRPDAPAAATAGEPTGIAFVGCGFVADFYAANLPLHPDLRLRGVFDHDAGRCAAFAARNGCRAYGSLEALLADDAVSIVVNLTNPASHHGVSRRALEAGRHLYSEKPLAMTLEHCVDLVDLAAERKLRLAAAPCIILGETAQTLRALLARNEIGAVRLVYAELDDGKVHQLEPDEWRSPAGTPWPWRDEFTVGCTLEHAGYHLAWLVDLFGPAATVTAFATTAAPGKHAALPAREVGPDFSVACIQFESGAAARLTCSIVAPHDHTLRIIGDAGEITVDECWHFGAPVRVRRDGGVAQRADSHPWVRRHPVLRRLFGLMGRVSELSPKAGWRRALRRHEMDYALGIAELAAAIREKRPCRITPEFVLHVNEIALAISSAVGGAGPVRLSTGARLRAVLPEAGAADVG